MTKKVCLFCETPLKGRIDKKFCDDQCRTAYNNRIKSDDNFMRNINNILRKNRLILKELVPPQEGKLKVSAQKLMDKGFNFHYHTHLYTTKTGNVYHFCYEYGYLTLEGNYLMLVKRDEERV
jgi:hypothetical protein